MRYPFVLRASVAPGRVSSSHHTRGGGSCLKCWWGSHLWCVELAWPLPLLFILPNFMGKP